MDGGLDDLREQIDKIDEELVRLLNRRQALAIEVGKLKKTMQSETYDPDRERKLLERLIELSDGPLCEEGLNQIYGSILNVSREAQRCILEEEDE